MSRLLLIAISVFALSHTALAVEITLGSGGESVIAKRGQTTTGCPENIANNKKIAIGGTWLALNIHEIKPTKLFVSGQGVYSDRPDELYFFKDIPIHAGKIVNGRIEKRKINTLARSEYDLFLGTQRYRFIEWGAWEFALQTLSPEGKAIKTDVYGSETSTIPPHVYKVTKEVRDDYEPGTLNLLRAGDFNGDNKVDLLLGYWSKEAGGLQLWLSTPKAEKYTAPYVSATEYSDCG